jgi:hypothetical protein
LRGLSTQPIPGTVQSKGDVAVVGAEPAQLTNQANATCAARSPNKGPKYLRWALVEAATHACTAAVYRDRYQQTKARIGKQRGAKVAQVDLARRLAEAIWHMLSRDQPFAPTGATDPLAA